MSHVEPALYLVTPPVEDASAFRPQLDEACSAGGVVAVLLRLAPADERTLLARLKVLVPVVQAHGAAAIVADPGEPADLVALTVRSGADGAQAAANGRLHELCERLKDGRNIGAGGLASKHDAMIAGELGVDYVMFGEERSDGSLPSLDLVMERSEWWAEIFQLPCVVVAPSLAAVPDLARTGADFIALGDAVWSHPAGPPDGVRAAKAAISTAMVPA